MIVMKFGGTSVGSARMIREAVEIVNKNLDKKPVVVVSAVSKITDKLIEAGQSLELRPKIFEEIRARHQEIAADLGLGSAMLEKHFQDLQAALSISNKATRKQLDAIMSFGERMSSLIFAEYARKTGLDARNYDAYDLGMVTDEHFGSAEILPETYGRILESFKAIPQGQVPIVTGFIGKTRSGEITTLGRGGSDYTAAIIGSAIDVDEVQIWTDADGIMTADPRIVGTAKTVETVSFDEASELAYFGAKVLHPKTILPVVAKNIPVKVLNTYNPSGRGTTILRKAENGSQITSISYRKNMSIININSERMFMMHGFMHKIFKIFDENKVAVDMVSTSEVNVSVTIDNKANPDISALTAELARIAKVSVESRKASVSIVGRAIKRHGVSGKMLSTLGDLQINIEMISQGASEINIGVVVDEDECEIAVRCLHKAFFGG